MSATGLGCWVECLDFLHFYSTYLLKKDTQQKNSQQPPSEAKNTRQFLWDDNSSGLRSGVFPAQCTERENVKASLPATAEDTKSLADGQQLSATEEILLS